MMVVTLPISFFLLEFFLTCLKSEMFPEELKVSLISVCPDNVRTCLDIVPVCLSDGLRVSLQGSARPQGVIHQGIVVQY